MAVMATASLFAGPVTRQQAQTIAQNYLFGKGRSTTYAKPVYRAPRRSAANQEQSYYYVFNADGGQGFVIVSGDDRTEQILGYSDQGAFDAAQLPEPVANFLQSYADQIKHLDDIGYTVAPERLKAPKQYNTRHAVAPLLKCRWGQGWPYNTHCPLYDGQNRAVKS